MTSLRVPSGTHDLHAVVTGDGPPVIFYHGIFGTHQQPRRLLGGLADQYLLVTPDARGRGGSPCPHGACHTWDRYVADVIALMDYLRLERATIGGSSFGSGIAVATALRHPDRVSRLVLLNPVYMGNATGLLARQADATDVSVWRDVSRELTRTTVTADSLAALADRYERPRWCAHDPASFVVLWEALASTRLRGLTSQPFDRLEELRALTMPLLIIPGMDDLHPPEVAQAYAAVLRDVTYADAGRLGLDDFEALAQVAGTDAFLDRLAAPLTAVVRDFLEQPHRPQAT